MPMAYIGRSHSVVHAWWHLEQTLQWLHDMCYLEEWQKKTSDTCTLNAVMSCFIVKRVEASKV